MLHIGYSRRSSALQLARRSAGIERESTRMRNLLLVTQVAVALLLLVGSGLMVRTSIALHAVDPGFTDPDEAQTFQIALSEADVGSIEQAVRTHQAILNRLQALPGVERSAFAGFNDALPLDGDGRSVPIYVGRDSGAGAGKSS